MNNLISMLRELDLEKNSKEDIRYVLNFIADELENIDLWKEVYKKEIKYNIEEADNNIDWYGKEYGEKVKSLTEEQINEIAKNLENDDEVNDCINNSIMYYIKEV